MPYFRPTWAEIDLDAIAHNLEEIKRRVGPSVKIMAIVKADGYGHGAVQVAGVSSQAGVDYLGVATLEEAIELREAEFRLPILVLDTILPRCAKTVIDYDLTQTICTRELALKLSEWAKKSNKSVKVHIEVDTGMGRLGIPPERAVDFIEELSELENLYAEGIFTQFALADQPDDGFNEAQIAKFRRVLRELQSRGIDIPLKHAANSAAILEFPQSFFNMVRPGLALYGLYPSSCVKRSMCLKPAMSLRTKVAYLKKVPSGTPISYGRTYITKAETTIATLPVGYGDGYNRLLSDIGRVVIKGKLASVVGRVCMDQIMVDVGNIPEVKIGDEVILMGRAISVEEIAQKIQTIPYEVVCMISKRVPRIYKGRK
jgi:alanine racemase